MAGTFKLGELTLPFKAGDRVVEFGGGENPLRPPGITWTNVDSLWTPQADLVADLNYPVPTLKSEEYDGVFSRFVLEHLKMGAVPGFIDEIHRVLKPGGVVVVITANLLAQAQKLVAKECWNWDDICMVFGGNPDYPGNYHKSSLSPEFAGRLFRDAGFHEIEVKPLPECETDMVITARKSEAVLKGARC